jgi:hypothetical protein
MSRCLVARLLTGVVACTVAAPAHAQAEVHPGMTEPEVVAALGEPQVVRRMQPWSYLFYANGCRSGCPSDDVVFINGCSVVGALFRTADRVWTGPELHVALRTEPRNCAADPQAGVATETAPSTPAPVVADTPAPRPPAPAPAETPRPLPGGGESARAFLALPTVELDDRHHPGPSGTLSTPNPFGAAGGEVFAGVGYQSRTRYTRTADGGAAVGIGIGRRDVAALEVTLSSYSTVRSPPLETGGLSFKAHRTFGRATSLAAGVENAVLWGTFDAIASGYVVAGHGIRLRADPLAPFSAALVTVGVGGGRFRTETDEAERNNTVNVFGSAAVRVARPLSLIANLTGQDLNLGASVKPFERYGLVATAGVADVTGTAGDGARFLFSLGYGTTVDWPF